MKSKTADQGIVLLVVLGVLALLSVLAITFVQMTRLEKSIAQNYVAGTRAMLAAESGAEYAISRLRGFEGGVIRPQEWAAMCYEEDPARPGLEFALKPSFNMPAPQEWYSGIVSSTFVDNGDVYKLKVEDESSKINLNDTNGKWNLDTDPDYDDPQTDTDFENAPGRLTMILENLGRILFDDITGGLLATSLMASRAELGGRFSSMDEVRAVLVPDILTDSQYRDFSKNVTLWNWQDPNTIRPTHKWNITVPDGMRPIPEYAERDIYLFSDWQTKGFEIEPRCPVNVNAASEELLKALIGSLQGWYLREGPAETISYCCYCDFVISYGKDHKTRITYYQYHYGDEKNQNLRSSYESFGIPSGHWKDARFGEAHITPDLAAIDGGVFLDDFVTRLYNRIHGDPGSGIVSNPIETWEEYESVAAGLLAELLPEDHEFWNEFWADWSPCPGGYEVPPIFGTSCFLPPDIDYPYWSEYGRKILLDLLLANFNPNSQLNDFNPDRHVFRMVDKAQLTRYSTEFCFEPTGCFQIDSLGQVMQAEGSVTASQKISTVIKAFDMFRISTQDQFMKGLEAASNESDLLEYCTPSPFGDSPWGAAITSYPEPMLENAAGDYIPGSIYDGQLMLSTYQYPLAQHPNGKFQISFEGCLAPSGVGLWEKTSPEIFTTNMATIWHYNTSTLFSYQGPRNQPTSDRLTYALGSQPDTSLPGILFPDGALSDAGRALGFTGSRFGDPGKKGRRGALQFWVKPNFDTQLGGRVRKLFCLIGGRYNGGIHPSNPGAPTFALFYLPHGQIPTWTSGGTSSLEKFPYGSLDYFYDDFCPPRSLGFGWGGSYASSGSVVAEMTPTAVSELPGRVPGQGESHHTYHFDPHQWTHFALRWDHRSGYDYLRKIGLYINNKRAADYDPSQAENHWNYSSTLDLYNDDYGEVYARFGEASHYPLQNFVADCTYDEIVSYRLPDDLGLDAQSIYTQVGRYINTENLQDTPVYLSPAWELAKELKLDRREVLTIRSVSWTLYWPDYNERRDYFNNPAGEQENPPLLPCNVNNDSVGFDPAIPGDVPDDPLVDILGWDQAYDPVSVDIAHIATDGSETWLADSNDNGDIYDDIADTLTYAGGSRVRLRDSGGMPLQFRRGDSFKFRVYFNVDDNQILYESPVLDDITFTFYLSRPRVLQWRVVR
ncbi:hypothetical protein ACFL54_01700 [Planctomycetota bacterium]